MTANTGAAPSGKPGGKSGAKATAKSGNTGPIVLEYDLDELPSSQHRAGLAGLVQMCRWLARQPSSERAGVCSLDSVGERRVTLRLDQAGLAALLDQTYGADSIERPYPRPFKKKPPLREEQIEEVDARTGKTKSKTLYYYPVVVPKGAFLADWYDDKPAWLKLWRDMVWNIMRGVPAARAPFNARAEGKPDKLVAQTWKELLDSTKKSVKSVDLPSTYYLGAQAQTAENVAFRDRAKSRFLLHFWPFVTPIYVPVEPQADGKRKFRGYVLTVPDVADVATYCDEIEDLTRERGAETAGYVPRDALIDLPVESAFDLMHRLNQRVAKRTANLEDLVFGADVFHVDKEGNNVRVLYAARVDVDPAIEAEYARLRGIYRDTRFRRQRLLNLFEHRPWYAGYDRIAATVPTEQTVESHWFRADARRAFQDCEDNMGTRDHEHTDPIDSADSNGDADATHETDGADDGGPPAAPTVEALIYRMARAYVAGKIKSKHDGLTWDKAKDKPALVKKYNEAREKLAKDAFLAVRSRTRDDFIAYFSGTLCSVPQWLNHAHFAVLSRALLDDTETVRTLTLLALSASAYSPRSKENKNGQAA